ncbi:hypothetical protein GCM10027168_11110 [Streptomyces capparidis]
MSRPYPFVAVEGLDGTGKTTLCKALFRLWRDLYRVTPLCLLTTNHLTAGQVPALIEGKFRPTPRNRDAYLSAVADDKRASLELLVRPHRPVRPVLADRWLLSEMAFFAVKHGMAPTDTYRAVTAGIDDGPDVTVVLDLAVAESVRRARGRPGDPTRPDWDTHEVQARVHEVYASVSARPGAFPLLGEVIRLDAGAGCAELLLAVWDALTERGLLPAVPRG